MFDTEFDQFLQRLKLLVPLEELVRERVPGLKKTGALWEACCPFHQERTPSFKVDPRKGRWRCYGACDAGGDAIEFLRRIDGVEFLEAVEALAHRTGQEVPRRSGAQRPDDERHAPALACLEKAAELWRGALRDARGRAALDYLLRRGLTQSTLDDFGLGFAPEGLLRERARALGLEREPLLAAGLIRRGEDGRFFEFFRNRITVPIRDRKGRVVGFGARVLGDGEPKYINSAESELFHKGRLIYGMDRALPEARRAKHLVLMEGYTDVMAAHQAGIAVAVAVLGTSFTEDHAALIRRSGARRVTLCFDGDEAGRKATGRALHGLLPLGLELDVARPPEGQDPGDLAGSDGAAQLRALIDGARGWFEVLVDELRSLPPARVSEGVNRALALIARLPEPVAREVRRRELAGALDLPYEVLRDQEAARERLDPTPAASRRPAPAAAAPLSPARAAPARGADAFWRNLIGALLVDNSLIPVHETLCRTCPEPDLGQVLRTLLELYRTAEDGAQIDAGRLMDALGDHPLRGLIGDWEELASRAGSAAELAEAQRRGLHEWTVKDNRREAERRRAEDGRELHDQEYKLRTEAWLAAFGTKQDTGASR